jgi:lipopolysaccharide export system permease protein
LSLFPGKTYSNFIIREFLKVFLVSIIFILGLSFIVRSIQNIEKHREFTFIQIIVLRLLESPEIILRECLLASCMFASVFTMSRLSKSNEILALRSCGVSVYKIITPLVVLGFLISVLSIVFEDKVVVKSIVLKSKYGAYLKGTVPREYTKDRSNIIIFGENNIIYKIDNYLSKEKKMNGVMIIQKEGGNKIAYRIDAETAGWDGKRWVFYNGVYRAFTETGSIKDRQVFSEFKTNIKDNPRYFGRETRSIENMTLKEGYKYTKMLRKMGFNYRKDLTQYHRKIATSFTFFLVIIIGLTLGSMPFKNALVISFSMTLGMVLVFFFIIEIGYTFGRSGKIPPILGGWMGNITFLVLCVYLLRKLRV